MDIRNFDNSMQKFLFKKDREYGSLKLISSRATEETSVFIDKLLDSIMNIAKMYNLYNVKMFYEDDCSKPYDVPSIIVSGYNRFLLNTSFSSQYLLAEDIMNGYIVDMWPTLSPYLFIQIIWHLKCEDMLIETLAQVPLDLCIEILDITIRCMPSLEGPRGRRFIFLLISMLYYKCMWLHLGTLSKHDMTELVHQLVAHFQTLLDLISSKFINSKLLKKEKYVQHGILLKYIFRYIKSCMRYKCKNAPEYRSESFRITYGNSEKGTNYFHKLPVDEVQSIVATLNQELVTLLEKEIKRVDCLEFMEWAEVDDEENIMISLQRAIIIESHCFIEFMKYDEFLVTNEHLLHCLEQFVGTNNSDESALTLQELCDSIMNGRLDEKIGMEELIKRYKTWDVSVLYLISKKTKLLSTNDFCILLEYLNYILAPINKETQYSKIPEDKLKVYELIMTILIEEPLSIMYFVVLQYTLRHFFEDNHLMCLFNKEYFQEFIENNINMNDEEKLRIILIFVTLNPKKVLNTLVRVTIGSSKVKYRNVMFKRHQLAYLHTFLISKVNDEQTLLTYFLNDVWLTDRSTWCYKQFEGFMNDMLDNEAITPDDLINNVYIRYLFITKGFNFSNMLSVLIHMYSVLRKKICTRKMNYVCLIIELSKLMSRIRKCCKEVGRNIVNSLLDRGRMILNILFSTLNLTPNDQNKIILANSSFEPIDQILLAPMHLKTMLRGTVYDVIQNYERRCFTTYHLQCKSNVPAFEYNRGILLRHMMLHASEEEYKEFAIEMTVSSWAYFGWADDLKAYDNVLRITTEAMHLALAFTDTFPKNTFVSLLRALVQYCNIFSRLKHRKKKQNVICDSLLKTLVSLKNIVNGTQYSKMYDNLLDCIENMSDKTDFEVADYFDNISELIELYFVQSEEIENGSLDKLNNGHKFYVCPVTTEACNMLKAYKFVYNCINKDLHADKKVGPAEDMNSFLLDTINLV